MTNPFKVNLDIRMMDKKEIRKLMRERRNQVSEEQQKSCSQTICQRLITLPEFNICKTILLYHSTQNEIDTTMIFQEAKSRGLRVGYPKVIGDTMRFFLVDDLYDLEEGYMGILEPNTERCEELQTEEGICILPGTAFDSHGNRIGYGKAFYDRYLSKFPNFTKIGVAYDFQVVDSLPSEPHDISLDFIITESRVIHHE